MHKTPKRKLPFSLSPVSTIFFSDNEIYEVILFQFPSCCFLFYEENSPLWIQKISSSNDCEANKQLSEDAGGRLKLTQKARNLARNSCIAVALNRPFPSWSKPLFQSDAKCKAVDMKMIIQYSHANKTNFHMKGFALSLVLKVRGFRTWSI